ncbi:hypothetical protein NVS55_12395 [Myxococcus stipitatus]|uniref:hypothetical protein n=1 Tax=Myxococcus stipitatus TaxID=83455 RepID=UPI0031453A89
MKMLVHGRLSLILGAMVFAGCGGPPVEDSPEVAPIPEQYLDSDDSNPEEGDVSAFKACCYIQCTDNYWRGPYRNVKYGNCRNAGNYVCATIGRSLLAAKWDDC